MIFIVLYPQKNLLLVFGIGITNKQTQRDREGKEKGTTYVSVYNGFTFVGKLNMVFLLYQFHPKNCQNRQETAGLEQSNT